MDVWVHVFTGGFKGPCPPPKSFPLEISYEKNHRRQYSNANFTEIVNITVSSEMHVEHNVFIVSQSGCGGRRSLDKLPWTS